MKSIENIVEKIKSGEEKKETLYKEIENFLLFQEKKYIPHAKNSVLDIGEIPSLVWLGVENAIASYEGDRNCKFLTWADRSIRYIFLEEFKKQNTREVSFEALSGSEEDGLSFSETIADPASFEAFSEKETALDGKKALDALKTLSEAEQKIITLCCIKNIPLAKCARGMGITESKARSLKLSALRKLKEKLS
ncbi:MAG: sigma-70 family RNA polymerase sigma factor [Clostridia bacterium]|nr:sigma-70 family RNA polymerase sigma factor [Clostridia bacterium]